MINRYLDLTRLNTASTSPAEQIQKILDDLAIGKTIEPPVSDKAPAGIVGGSGLASKVVETFKTIAQCVYMPPSLLVLLNVHRAG